MTTPTKADRGVPKLTKYTAQLGRVVTDPTLVGWPGSGGQGVHSLLVTCARQPESRNFSGDRRADRPPKPDGREGVNLPSC